MTAEELTTPTDDEVTYCAVHPDVETGLRCNRCGRYMCAQCAVQTPIGYRCRECVRNVEDRFFAGTDRDYVLAAAAAAGIAAVGGVIAGAIGFLILSMFLGVIGGGVVAEGVLRATEKRRGRYTAEIATGATVVGGFIGAILWAYQNYPETYQMIRDAAAAAGVSVPPGVPSVMSYALDHSFSDLSVLVFVIAVAITVYSRFKV
jgi:MFS family permease